MVKRLRRHPLTVESGVRFPLGVPMQQTNPCGLFFYCQKFAIWFLGCYTLNIRRKYDKVRKSKKKS